MMLPPAWAVSRIITRQMSGCLLRLGFIGVSALVFTTWAIYFQSLLAYSGIVHWDPTGGFFGIPWQHFFSIYFISGLITFAVAPKHLHGGPLVLIYILTWLIDLISLFFFHEISWTIIFSSILMGVVILLAMLVA
jgi:hypothetical protein